MCEWKPDFDTLNSRVDGIEARMTQVEHDVGKMRSETQEGFKSGAEQMSAINPPEARFTPALSGAERERRSRDWHRAVERARGWAEE